MSTLTATEYNRESSPMPSGNAPVKVKGTFRVAFVAGAVSLLYSLYAYTQEWFLLYSDAQSHLTIARRLYDSPSPGFDMLGTVWLPVPHLLLTPLTAIYSLWVTGWAGAILGALCMMVSAGALWRIGTRVKLSKWSRIVVVAVFVLNPSMLYLSCTALTEPVLLAALLSATAGLTGWIYSPNPKSMGELVVFAGIPSGIAVLSRYEGWMFIVVGTVFVLFTSYRRWRSLSYTIGLTASYIAVPFTAVAWWLSYNWVRFNDPLSFARDEYSAAAQQNQLYELGLLPTKGNLGLSIWTYNWDLLAFIGVPLAICAFAGGILLIIKRGFDTSALSIWMTGFAYPFAVVALFLGQTAVRNDHTLPTGLFNLRYAAVALPLVALLCGVLSDEINAYVRKFSFGKPIGSVIIVAVLSMFLFWSYSEPVQRIGVMAEGYANANGQTNANEATQWLADNYDGGGLLIDEGANPVLIKLGMNLSDVTATYTGDVYTSALENPRQVKWIYTNTGSKNDRVWAKLGKDVTFQHEFVPAFSSGPVTVWKRL